MTNNIFKSSFSFHYFSLNHVTRPEATYVTRSNRLNLLRNGYETLKKKLQDERKFLLRNIRRRIRI